MHDILNVASFHFTYSTVALQKFQWYHCFTWQHRLIWLGCIEICMVHFMMEQTMHRLERGLDVRMAEPEFGNNGLKSRLEYCKLIHQCVYSYSLEYRLLSCFTLNNFYSTHTHPLNGPLSRTPGWAGTGKVKPIWILLKQETVSGSGISCAICKSAPRCWQITTPAPHHSWCHSCHPTDSVKS